MGDKKLFQYAVLWHPTETQKKEKNLSTQLIVDVNSMLAKDSTEVNLKAATLIPVEFHKELGQIEILVRPF